MNAREVFLHRRLGAGWVTLCAYLDPVAAQTSVGVALCSPWDQFSRRIGRLIASGRRKKRPAFDIEFSDDEGAGSPTRQIEECFRAWLVTQYGGGATVGDDEWISDAIKAAR